MEREVEILKRKLILNRLFFITTFLFTCLVYGQGDDLYDHGLDHEKWQDIRDGIRYEGQEEGPGREWTYESNEEYNRERGTYERGESGGGGGNGSGGSGDGSSYRDRQNYTPPPSNTNYESPSFSGLGVFGWILLGLFCGLLIFLIYYLFVNTETKGAKIKGDPIDFDEVNPTEIPLTELERLLQEALANKDFRGAVRIYFIFIVRDLAEKNWIKWEKEKTNFHYLREMSGKSEFEDFNVSVSYFEIIWYGKRELDADKFEQVKPKFTRFLDKLGVK